MLGIEPWLLRRFFIRRSLLHLGATAAVVLAVALAVCVTSAVRRAAEASVLSFEKSVPLVGGSESITVASAVSAISLDELRLLAANLGLRYGVLAGRRILCTVEADGVTRGSLGIFAADGNVSLASGAAAGDSSAIPLLLAPTEAERLKLREGDTVQVRAMGGDRAESAVIRISRELGATGAASPYLLAERLTGELLFTKVIVHPNRGASLLADEARADVDGAVQLLGRQDLTVEDGRDRRDRGRRLLAAFNLNIAAMTVMTLLIGLLVVYGSGRIRALGMRAELALLHTVGIPRSTLAALLSIEAALLGAVGGIIGASLGAPLASTIQRLLFGTAATLYGANLGEIHWRLPALDELLPAVLAGALLCAAGSALPALSSLRLTPGFRTHQLFESAPARPRAAIAALLAGASGTAVYAAHLLENVYLAHLAVLLTLMTLLSAAGPLLRRLHAGIAPALMRLAPIAALLSRGTLSRGVRVLTLPLGSAACVMALLFGMGVMIASFRGSLQQWITLHLSADYYLRAEAPQRGERSTEIPADVLRALRSLPGIDELLPYAATEIELGGELFTVAGTAMQQAAKRNLYRLSAGRMPLADHELLISESAARKGRFAPGGIIALGGSSFTVSGIYRDYSSEQGALLLELDAYYRLTGASAPQSVGIYLGEPRQATAQRIEDLAARNALHLLSNRELARTILDIFDETFTVTEVMRLVVLLLAFFSMLLSLLQLSAEQRESRLLLRQIGVLPEENLMRVMVESTVLASAAIVIGAPAGLLLAHIFVELINPLSFGWRLAYHLDAATVLLPCAAIAGCVLAAGLAVFLAELRIKESYAAEE